MEVVHGRDLTFEDNAYKHRPSGIGFKYLSRGVEGTPENYALVLARQKDFYSPVHKHNFDQFRFAVEGEFSLKPDLVLKEGQLSYHPEGQYYGPQNDGPEHRVLLVLQMGGASGQGYMSFEALKKANKALSEGGKGEFKGGKYYPEGSEEGKSTGEKRGIVDGYQACWEWFNGKKLVYPKPRYHAPICMDPESAEWRPVKGGSNAFRKHLGTFSERETRAEILKIEKANSGKLLVGGNDAIHLIYVLEGQASAGNESLTKESCITLPAGQSCEIMSESGVDMIHFEMPMMSGSEVTGETTTNGNHH